MRRPGARTKARAVFLLLPSATPAPPLSLHPAELAVITAALSRTLAGAVVQKVSSPDALRTELELRSPGRTIRLVVCAESGLARISIASARSPAAGAPSPWLLRLRKELVGSRLVALESAGAREVELRFERQAVPRTLVLEVGAQGALLLLGEGRRPLAASAGRARAPRPPSPTPAREPASRLPELSDPLELGRAAEALFSAQQTAVRTAALRRQRVQPLRTRVERLRRTVEKVRVEANRTAAAEEHRRFGELLRQNAQAVPRGAREVTLTEYSAEGACEVSVPLDPALDARAQAERHFQRYRRLTRGSARAGVRLTELQRELADAEAALEAAREAPDAVLLAPGTTAPAAARARRPSPRVHQPYRVFHARSGDRILVGRAGRDNDALTFAVARPDDLWLHARGLPGAHVLVPLPRGGEVPAETLLDAAHLALHHTRGASEDRGEVSYTRAKFVRKVKGGAPGAVTYSREKTFLVRLEAERLERLLASREER
jgi:predicted ribosome quality control (RQC) complex YloA/Tae2 family protein